MFKLYIGNEPYLSFKEAIRFTKTFKDNPELEYISIDVEKEDSGKIIDLISSQSLFSPNRVIFLKRVYKNKKKEDIIEFLLEYLPNLQNDRIIIWEDQKVSAVTKYVKFFKKEKCIEEFNKLNKRTFSTWAKSAIEENSIKLDSGSMRLLSEYSNYDPERFENILKKIKLLNKESITQEDIELLSPNTLEQDIWKLLDDINNNSGNQINTLEKILRQGIDPNYIIAMIARNLRLITLTKTLRDKGAHSKEIASVIKVPPFTVPSLIKASERYNGEMLKKVYEKLTNLDYEIKVGRIDSKLGITLLCTIL